MPIPLRATLLVLPVLLLGSRCPEVSASGDVVGEHVLNRVTYGPNAWSRTRIQELGVRDFIAEQLDPASIDDGAAQALLAQFPSLTLDFETLFELYGFDEGQTSPAEIVRDLQQARILRAVASRRQLQELLVDFWFDHFNVLANGRRHEISPYERIAIRPHVLGRFEDMLLAVARSPAMADYLDNKLNRVNAGNENYSRELMELHTLGVDGPYTEADVVEVARCFTGWRVDFSQPDGFTFSESRHDQGAKLIMGTLQIPENGGYQDGVDVIRFLAGHPATARFISRKLLVRFLSEDPPQSLVDGVAGTFLATGGDLKAVMEAILLSPEFLEGEAYRNDKVKRPVRLLASMARALDADPAQLDLRRMSDQARDQGEELMQAPAPTGHPDRSSAWTSPGTMVSRFNDAERVARGEDGYVFDPPPLGDHWTTVDGAIQKLFFAGVSLETRTGAIGFVAPIPLNEQGRMEGALAYLLSSPEFQLH